MQIFNAFEEEKSQQETELNASMSKIVDLEQNLQESDTQPIMESKGTQTRPIVIDWFQVCIPPMLMKWIEHCYLLKVVEFENNRLKRELVMLKESFHQAYRGKQDACEIGELLLACRRPSRLYSMFLNEQLLRWALQRIRQKQPHDPDVKEFVKLFFESLPKQHNFLCELFVHNLLLEKYTDFFIYVFVEEAELRSFMSTMRNQLHWKDRSREYAQAENIVGLQIRYPHRKPISFKKQFLGVKSKQEARVKYDNNLRVCHDYFQEQGPHLIVPAWHACEERYTPLPMLLKKREIISPLNIRWSYGRATALIKILVDLKTNWIGMRYKPPLLLSPPPLVYTNLDQSEDGFSRWKQRVTFHQGFLRNPDTLDTEADDVYDLSAKYEEMNRRNDGQGAYQRAGGPTQNQEGEEMMR